MKKQLNACIPSLSLGALTRNIFNLLGARDLNKMVISADEVLYPLVAVSAYSVINHYTKKPRLAALLTLGGSVLWELAEANVPALDGVIFWG